MLPIQTFRINQVLLDELHDHCINNNISVSGFIRKAIFNYLSKHQ